MENTKENQVLYYEIRINERNERVNKLPKIIQKIFLKDNKKLLD